MTQRLAIAALVIVFSLLASPSSLRAEDIGGAALDSAAPAAAPAQGDATPQPQAAASEGADADTDAGDAQPSVEGEPLDGPAPADKPGFNPILLIVAAALLMFMFMGSGRKQEKKRKQMLADLKKGDRITTIGGMVGSVLEVREKDVLVKIDEGSNTRVRMARWAIRTVGTPEEEESK